MNLTFASQMRVSQIHPQVVNWYQRVKTAGRATPGFQTMNALNTFYNGLVQNNLSVSFKSLNCIVPDNLIAATVPLINNYGNSPWINTNFDCFGGVGGRIGILNSIWTGFISGNRIASNNTKLYRARSNVAFEQIQTGAGASDMGLSTLPIFFMTANGAGSLQSIYYSTKRISFAAIHEGFTIIQCQTFFNLIQTMKQNLGGGYV